MFTETLVTMQDRTLPTDPIKAAASGPIAPAKASVEAIFTDAWPVAGWRDVNVAVAVSGGADSVALLHAVATAKRQAAGRGEVFVLHFDHRVRDERSAGDAAWVEALAKGSGARFVVGRSASSGPRGEEALRDERRAFYEESVDQIGARFLATGHTADDQAETVLFRLLRGTGPRGLAGIRPFTPLNAQCVLARPLLSVTRAQVIAYLTAVDQIHREDETNASDNYNRNWLRHRVLPLLAERFPAAAANLAASASRAAETTDLVESLAADLLANAASPDGPDRIVFDTVLLATQPPALVVETLRLAWRRVGWPEQKMTAEHWQRLATLAAAGAADEARVFPGVVRVQRLGTQIVLARTSECEAETGSC